MRKEQRNPELVRLWLREHPAGQRTMNDVLAFNGWLAQNHSELLPSTRYGDTYQQLKTILKGHIESDERP